MKDVFGKRNVMESFNFHPTLILLYLNKCPFYNKFNLYICNKFCTAVYTVYNRMNFLIYTYLNFTFYVNTISLTPSSRFSFVLECR